MGKTRSALLEKDDEERARRRVILFSRRLVFAALAFLVLFGICDTVYLTWEMKSHGHLHAGFATVVIPLVAVFYVVISWWDWRWVPSHSQEPMRGQRHEEQRR